MTPLEALTAATRALNESNAAYEVARQAAIASGLRALDAYEDAVEAARAAGHTAEQIDEATERGYE